MRNNRVFLFVLSALAILVLFELWHHEPKPILSETATSGSGETQVSKAFTKTTGYYKHLGYLKVVYTKSSPDPTMENSVLVVSSMANENSFGLGRLFKDFYKTIGDLEYPKTQLSLAFYCGSESLLNIVSEFFEQVTKSAACPYNKVTILYAPFLQTKFKTSEHAPEVQRIRRRSIARGRNFVLLNSLDTEQFTLFMDADIIGYEHPDMLKRFVESDKDIIVPRITRARRRDYDRNSWRGKRIMPTEEELNLMDDDNWEDADFVPEDVEGEIFHLGDHAKEVKNLPETDKRRDLSYTVPLDSVGGAVLFVKSIIYKQGLVFPTMNVVGTAWLRKEGYDGIETEGLCYIAQTSGYKCHAMPNLVAQHASLKKSND